MTTLVSMLSTLGVVGSIIWVWNLVHLARHRDRVVFLRDCPAEPPAGGWPPLAVVFAARDEEESVEQATRSMLAQDYPGLEVIAVDDRSTDATGAILDAIGLEDDRLRVVHVEELPPGWLGKTHALHRASEATDARWILFTDADVFFEPLALRKAVAFAESDRLDHLTAFPDVLAESAWERLFLAFFGLIFSMNAPLGRIENRESRAHAGVGAFNLVRLEALRAIGGLRHLALSVDEDMRLGQALKYAGYRARILFGRGEVAVRWQVGMGGMIRGLEKNFFAALDFRVAKAIVASVGLVSLGVLPYLGLFLGPLWARLACGLGVASIAIMLGASTRHSRIGWAYSALLPIAAVALVFALGRSTLVTFWRGGVRWRDHLYPLEDLQRHVRARNAWLREVWRSTR